jgi:hypothetical protein
MKNALAPFGTWAKVEADEDRPDSEHSVLLMRDDAAAVLDALSFHDGSRMISAADGEAAAPPQPSRPPPSPRPAPGARYPLVSVAPVAPGNWAPSALRARLSRAVFLPH